MIGADRDAHGGNCTMFVRRSRFYVLRSAFGVQRTGNVERERSTSTRTERLRS